MTPDQLNDLAARVSSGYRPTSTETLRLVNTIRALWAERAQWPRAQTRARVQRAGKTGAKASPKRYSHV